MNRKLMYPILVLLLIGMACNFLSGGGGGTEVPKATNTPQAPKPAATNTKPPAQPTATQQSAPAQPTATLQTSPATAVPTLSGKPGAITNLQDAEKATIRIVSQVSIENPDLPVSVEDLKGGSGFIIDPSGLAITNNHVVSGAALIDVYFSGDEKAYRSKLLAVSECSDLALIDIEGDGYPFMDWYTGELKLGLKVYSLGYPLGDKEFTRHEGTISKKSAPAHRTNWTDVESVVEHDAIINPGSSGGPLVTEDGKIVGVNYSSIQGANQYYAITYKEIKPILDEMKNGKDVLSTGINGEAFITDKGDLSGIWVYSVRSGSAADKAGVKSGDILLEMEGITIAKKGTMEEYCGILRGHKDTDALKIKLVRYKTSELLEGQLNGRELEIVGTFKTSGGNSGDQGNTGGGEAYYKEEFDGDISQWKYYVTSGNEKNSRIERVAGILVLTIGNPGTYIYVFNEKWSYQDVVITTKIKNTGDNNMGTSLVCRRSDRGWYEMRAHPNGTFEVFRYDQQLRDRGQNPYVRLSPPTSAVPMKGGNTTNTFSFGCVGSNLLVYVNGQEVAPNNKRITDDTLAEGLIGIGGDSEGAKQGVKLEFEYVDILKP